MSSRHVALPGCIHGQRNTQCKRCGHRTPEPRLETRRACRFCKKEMARQCIYEHEKWHCPQNPNRMSRSFKKKQCPDCGKRIHEKSFARHRRSHRKRSKRRCSKSDCGFGVFKGVRPQGFVRKPKEALRGESGNTTEAIIFVHNS